MPDNAFNSMPKAARALRPSDFAKRGGAPGLGGAPIIMTFVILCLTIFAALTLSTAVAEFNLSNSYAISSKDYYDADLKAVTFVALLRTAAKDSGFKNAALSLGAEIFESGGKTIIKRDFDIGEGRQVLRVALAADELRLQITSWQIVYTDEWLPSTSFNLWTGE